MGKPIRVLQVLGTTDLGGAESRTMDLYRNVDRGRVQFDFAVHTSQKGYFDEEIESLGGYIYRLPKFRMYNGGSYRRAWKAFFAGHPGYACVHGHMTSTAGLYLPIAKAAGVPLTVAHARSAGVDRGPKGVATRLLRMGLAERADFCLAASALAGEAVFGKKAWERGRVRVVPNAITAQKYGYRPAVREEMRKRLGLENALVLGHVGRFHPCKNHPFLMEIFAEVQKHRPDSHLLLLGEGAAMEQVQRQAQEAGLSERVHFLGNRGDVYDYYQAMDCFVFPSFYEGFPGTVLEAQAAGLPCIVSDSVTREAGVTGLAEFAPLEEGAAVWAKRVLAAAGRPRFGRVEEICEKGYDTGTQAAVMQRFYETGEWG